MGSSQDKGVGVCRDGIMGYVMPFSKPLAKYNSTVLFVLIFNYLLSAAIWSNLWHAHVSGFVVQAISNALRHSLKIVKDSSVSQSYHFSDRRDCIGILQEFSVGKNRWKQNYYVMYKYVM